MKRSIVLAVFLGSSYVQAGCILRHVINYSITSEIIIRGVMPVAGTERATGENLGGVVVKPRSKKSHEPRIVTGNWSTGEYLRVIVNETSPQGVVCKKYRVKIDDDKKQVIVGKKESCAKGVSDYDESLVHPLPMPSTCFIDVIVKHDPNSFRIDVIDQDGQSVGKVSLEGEKQPHEKDAKSGG